MRSASFMPGDLKLSSCSSSPPSRHSELCSRSSASESKQSSRGLGKRVRFFLTYLNSRLNNILANVLLTTNLMFKVRGKKEELVSICPSLPTYLPPFELGKNSQIVKNGKRQLFIWRKICKDHNLHCHVMFKSC